MSRAARVLTVMPLVVGLGWLSAQAVEQGIAGTEVFETGLETSRWAITHSPPTAEALVAARDALMGALKDAPGDPAAHELLGIVASRSVIGPEYASEADVHFVKAIELRPTSPYTWANLAAVRYRRGDTGPAFDAALENAVLLGRYESEVQRTVADVGLAVWNEKGPTTQAAIEGAVAAGMKRNPLEMLQIADRRGRLAVPCRHFAGSTRQIDPKWVQLCESMEATS